MKKSFFLQAGAACLALALLVPVTSEAITNSPIDTGAYLQADRDDHGDFQREVRQDRQRWDRDPKRDFKEDRKEKRKGEAAKRKDRRPDKREKLDGRPDNRRPQDGRPEHRSNNWERRDNRLDHRPDLNRPDHRPDNFEHREGRPR